MQARNRRERLRRWLVYSPLATRRPYARLERWEASMRRHPTLWLWAILVPTFSTLKAIFPHGGFNPFTHSSQRCSESP